MSIDRQTLEKLEQPQLVDYTIDLIAKFNEQVTNYNTLYTEYTKQLEQLTVAQNEFNVPNDEVLKIQEQLKLSNDSIIELQSVVKAKENELAELQKTNDKITKELSKAKEKTSTKDKAVVQDNSELIKEIEDLKNEIDILKAQKSSTKLTDINSLEKCSQVPYIVQTYTINGFENRVDNSEVYGGRQFVIATVLIKLENLTFTWNLDFKGSELYKPENQIRTLTIKEEDLEKIKIAGKAKGMFVAIKDVFGIKDNFSPDSFFNSAIMVAGAPVEVETIK